VNLGLKIKLDADHQASIFQFTIAVDGSLQEVSGVVVKTGASRGRDMAQLPTSIATSLAVAVATGESGDITLKRTACLQSGHGAVGASK
jgi:hypothetical protein